VAEPSQSGEKKKDEELDAIKKAVDDAASVGGGLWLSYLFVLFYLAVAAGAVTHADLFLENPVKLPFLNIELPLLAFFFLAPILFIIVHAYTLVHLVMLTEKAKRFHEAVHDQERNVDPARRENLQWQLPSNIFIQFLVGPEKIRRGLFGSALRAIAWITLVIAPIFLLLFMQAQFLPFHSSFIAWTQRIALLADLILLLWLWRKVLSGPELGGPFRACWAWPALGFALSLAVLAFSWTVATFPGEWQEELLPSWEILPAIEASQIAQNQSTQQAPQSVWERAKGYWDWIRTSDKVSLHDWVFQSPVDDTSRRRWLPFSNTLVLSGFNILEGLGIDDPKKADWRDFVFRARGRDLTGARFDLASLPRVDFTGANLVGAFLYKAQLDRASLEQAQLQDAWLGFAQLQGASLKDARLQGASLQYAQLPGATLDSAQLQGASLFRAHLQGASLQHAQLQGAWLDDAQLQGASLFYAQLQGASLLSVQLHGATLDSAQLQGASLLSAQLPGATLDSAQLQGAFLQEANLEAADLSNTFLWRTSGPLPKLPEASKHIKLTDPSIAPDTWRPSWRDRDNNIRPWNNEAYRALRRVMESVPAGELRDRALNVIRSLDCADKTLASCDPDVPLPREAAAWREALEAANVDNETYAAALAKTLKELVCSGGDNDAIHILRGVGFQSRLRDAGPAMSGLIDDLTNKDSKDCPVSASLTDADRAKLLQLKQEAGRARK
jgi:uncharacterized protein YjbI with pentapeptide repeats